MSEIKTPGSKNTLIGVGDGNPQTGDVTFTNNIGQQEDSSNSQEVDNLLSQLKEYPPKSPLIRGTFKIKLLKGTILSVAFFFR